MASRSAMTAVVMVVVQALRRGTAMAAEVVAQADIPAMVAMAAHSALTLQQARAAAVVAEIQLLLPGAAVVELASLAKAPMAQQLLVMLAQAVAVVPAVLTVATLAMSTAQALAAFMAAAAAVLMVLALMVPMEQSALSGAQAGHSHPQILPTCDPEQSACDALELN